MSTNDIAAKAKELQELRFMREELEAWIAAIEDEIKAAMGENEQITAGNFRIAYKPVTTCRVDIATMKRELPEIVSRYMKSTTFRRFTIC